LKAFPGYAEAEATATLRALIAQAAKPALAELEALRVALDVRCESLTATLAGSTNIDPVPLQELTDRLVHAAAQEASEAARAARQLALEEAEARLALERADAEKQLEQARAEAAHERTAGRLELASLTEALAKARVEADAVRADIDAQIQAARNARNEADAIRADRDAHLESVRVARSEASAIRADRDAQLQAVTAAREQLDAIRADRDVHVEAARAAREQLDVVRADKDSQRQTVTVVSQQLDAIRAERDAHIEAARVAKEQLDAVRADKDAQLQAVVVATQQLDAIRAERDAQVEAARATREQLDNIRLVKEAQVQAVNAASQEIEAVRAERDAQIEAARVARAQAEAIAADRDAQLDAARAQMTQLLADTHAQLEAACMESERRAAAQTSEIEALRSELEQVRADALGAEASRTEERASRPVAPVAVEPVVLPAPVETAATPAPRQERRPEPHHVSAEWAAPPPPAAPPLSAEVATDRLRRMCLAIDDATNISQVLDGLIDGVGAAFPRAALFVVKAKAKRLQGWRSVGFTGAAAITREFEFSLATDSALTRAVNASRMVFTGEVTQGAQAANGPGETWTVTFPVITNGRVVAVVHADGGGRNGEQAPALDRKAALEISEELVRRAGVRLTALTTSAQTAFGNVLSETPATEAPATAVAPVAPATPVATVAPIATVTPVTPETPAAALPTASQDDAGRYASQLAFEMNRYKQPAAAQPLDFNLQERLAVEIEGSRHFQAAPAPSVAGNALGMFDEALGKMLGNDGLDAGGPSEPAVAALPPLFVVKK
jgi:hypothetical protein